MQSHSPWIIRHYVPLQFSRDVVDMSSPPKRTFVPKEDNPLQNIKLRQIEKQTDPDFLLIFTNKTFKEYKPKKQLKYKHLIQQIKEENTKYEIIREHIKNTKSIENSPEREKSMQRQSSSKPSLFRSKNRQKRKQSHDNIQEDSLIKRILNRKNYSSAHIRSTLSRESKRPCLKAKTLQQKHQNGERHSSQNKPLKLKVRGSKAPTGEVVDHLKRHSLCQVESLYYSYK